MSVSTDIPYWLALTARSALPISKIEELYSRKKSIEALWTESVPFLKQNGFAESEIRKIFEIRNTLDIKYFKSLESILTSINIKIIRYVDDSYPALLKDFGHYNIKPPSVLLLKGNFAALGEGVAIVGTRECSFHGHTMARKLARTIAKAGYIIYSGLARGIDTEAHCGALEARGRTVGVLPWLSDKEFYPEENFNLAHEIIKKGAIISEYYDPPREHPSQGAPAAFVLRNRITSGLARCVILVESGGGAGTYRQAAIARDQGRQMFAVKPKKDNKIALEGFNQFVKMGATPIDSPKPVLEFLKQIPSKKGKDEMIDKFYERLQ
jgi:DNA processing protein